MEKDPIPQGAFHQVVLFLAFGLCRVTMHVDVLLDVRAGVPFPGNINVKCCLVSEVR